MRASSHEYSHSDAGEAGLVSLPFLCSQRSQEISHSVLIKVVGCITSFPCVAALQPYEILLLFFGPCDENGAFQKGAPADTVLCKDKVVDSWPIGSWRCLFCLGSPGLEAVDDGVCKIWQSMCLGEPCAKIGKRLFPLACGIGCWAK
jgi:hypothetical protein